MAILSGGIFGSLQGRIGPLVFYFQNGKNIVRRRPHRKKANAHPNLLAQRAKFSLCTRFLKPLRALLNQTYRTRGSRTQGYYKAFSYTIRNALSGSFPNFSIDYSRVGLSQGNLPNPITAACTSPVACKLAWRWSRKCEMALASTNDKAFVAVYCESLGQWIYNQDAASRNAGNVVLDASLFGGQPVHTWIGFVSADGKLVSESIYTGVVNVL
jgi:hypothetical protein